MCPDARGVLGCAARSFGVIAAERSSLGAAGNLEHKPSFWGGAGTPAERLPPAGTSICVTFNPDSSFDHLNHQRILESNWTDWHTRSIQKAPSSTPACPVTDGRSIGYVSLESYQIDILGITIMANGTPREQHQAEVTSPSISQSSLDQRSRRLHFTNASHEGFISFCENGGHLDSSSTVLISFIRC
jgi:hypothetical protein